VKKILGSILAAAAIAALVAAAPSTGNRAGTYDVTGDVIEACSCTLFCPCYFNSEPGNAHMCQFNNAYKLRPGSHWGNVDLSNAKVWLSGDLGEALSTGTASYVMVTFDRKTTPAQRDAIGKVMGKIYPVKWAKMETREDDIDWRHDVANKADHAKMASGMAEVTLKRGQWESTKMPTVISGLKYFGASGNDGFILAKGTHYFHGDAMKYDLKDMNGFFVTVHSKGKIEPAAQQSGRP
jgi:hypothetical protein